MNKKNKTQLWYITFISAGRTQDTAFQIQSIPGILNSEPLKSTLPPTLIKLKTEAVSEIALYTLIHYSL